MNDLVCFIDWSIITLNGECVILTILFDWMSVLFIEFVCINSSLIILCSDDCMFGDLNIYRFIMLGLMFVVSIIFLIVSPNVSRILFWF
jgi:NADH-ubiquinone oxidoreductase chain 5